MMSLPIYLLLFPSNQTNASCGWKTRPGSANVAFLTRRSSSNRDMRAVRVGLVTEPTVTKCSRPGGGKEKIGLTKLIWHGCPQYVSLISSFTSVNCTRRQTGESWIDQHFYHFSFFFYFQNLI